MEKATDKQTALLKRLGATFDYNMSKDEASALIEQILSKGNDRSKEIPAKMVETFAKDFDADTRRRKYKPFDTSSYFVAYAKDLCVAMLNAEVEVLKEAKSAEIEDVGSMMGRAILCIKQAKKEFEK